MSLKRVKKQKYMDKETKKLTRIEGEGEDEVGAGAGAGAGAGEDWRKEKKIR